LSKHFDLDDALTIEEGTDDPLTAALALQRAINSGSAWSMQGSMGRAMMRAIEAGDCLLGPSAAHDYYDNRIPGRKEVQPGTKGSREYVVAAHDEDWAAAMENA
jgi:hypothetical protein